MHDVDIALDDLVTPIQLIKVQVLNYLQINHSRVIRNACLGDCTVGELVKEQVEEEVNSLLKVINRFKESLAVTHTELQYGEPSMEEDPNDHAPEVKEDSKHWEGIELEMKHVKE